MFSFLKYLIIGFLFFLSISLSAQSNRFEKWTTRFEKSNYLETETYAETMDYFKKLSDNSEIAKFIKIGTSPQGRDIMCLIVAKGKEFNPESAKKSGKAIILIQNGIHSGEIEGKDASMILLREVLVEKKYPKILNHVILLVIPIFNVDGHERRSKYNRINQNGPTGMGWRVTAQNLNLNRDYTKADTPEMKSVLKLFSSWLPDIYIDTHTTDGADYQYTITYDISTYHNIPPQTRNWIKDIFKPYVNSKVEKDGFLIAPYAGFIDRKDITKGIRGWVSGPRFSHGYAAIQNRPGLLIETHMLKPYKQRVFATLSLLKAVISLANKDYEKLVKLNKQADKYEVQHFYNQHFAFPLSFKMNDKFEYFNFKGIKSVQDSSWITGSTVTKYTGKKETFRVPYYHQDKAVDSVYLPEAYIVPKEWSKIIPVMQLHGIEIDTLKESKKYNIEIYKFKDIKFPNYSYESHFSPTFKYDVIQKTKIYPAGTFIINTNQRTLGVIANLLEPKGRDSFVKWGFFNAIFERKEYFEEYSMEPIAEKMAENNPKLKQEFLTKVNEDEKFRNNPRERLNFFYKRSPYYDSHYLVYPVARVPFKKEKSG
ncbi:zinc carboxypeptidase [bacterium BMS3Abin04]|nr:zinc carboxypeptidase [bacterium BMS3Abin04]